jgi:hypothetical protein
MYLGRGTMVGRINDRDQSQSCPFNLVCGLNSHGRPICQVSRPTCQTKLSGAGNAANLRVALTLLTGAALAGANVLQVGGTDSAPMLAARPIPADTAPPKWAKPIDPSVLATLLRPAPTSVNPVTESTAATAEFLARLNVQETIPTMLDVIDM